MALINAVDCNKDFLGTGIGTCEVFLNSQMTGIILVPNGWSLPIDATGNLALTLSSATELVEATTFDPVFGAVEFTDNTGDATTVDYTGGITAVVRNAKPTYQLRFETSIGQHTAIYSKNGFKNKSVLLVFGGTIVGAYSPDGREFTGLKMGMINAQTLRLPAGDTRMGTLVDFQLTDEEQFNRRIAVLTADGLGFDISAQINPIQNAKLTAVATAGDPIQVSVKSVNNTNYGIEGLEAANFRVVNVTTNAVVALSSVTEGAIEGTYTLTPATGLVQGNQIYVQLYDSVNALPTAVLEVDGMPIQMYKGKSLTITVGA